MSGLKLTSPGVLLILAVMLAGGIILLDAFCLKPYIYGQQEDALQQQAVRAQEVTQSVLNVQQDHLFRICKLSSRQEPGGRAPSEDSAGLFLQEMAGEPLFAAEVDLSWVADSSGDVIAFWASRRDVPASTESALRNSVAQAMKLLGSNDAQTGLLRLADRTVMFAQCDLLRPDVDPKPSNKLYTALFLDSELLSQIGQAVGGSVVLVASQALPEGKNTDDLAHRTVWTGQDGQLAVAWLAYDVTGGSLGCFRADIPVVHIHRQAKLARRIVLIILSLSVGLVLLIVLGAHMLITGPIIRLLMRLKQLEDGDGQTEDLTQDLHGEPLVLARRLESAFEKMAIISRTDQLTGLANRRHFNHVLECFYQQSRRYNRQLSVLVMDVDFFKAVNDAGGHDAGDQLLKAIARCVKNACRKADLPARIGGDEFGVLLPETGAADAEAVAERIRSTVAAEPIVARNLKMNVTISMGLTDLNAGPIDSAMAMVSMADKALYVAKDQGRNSLVLAHDLVGPEADRTSGEESGRIKVLHKKLAGLDMRFKDIFLKAIEEIMGILEHRDPHMADHARKVRDYALLIAREMELPPRLLNRIQIAAMLHDIGMVAMPDSIVLNPGQLEGGQLEMMKRHSLLSVRIMEGMEFLEQEIPAVRYHHERFDGTGYPEGLKGPAIPLTARILAVADAFDAMTSPRTYRPARGLSEALDEIAGAAGKQFDPAVVDAFLCAAAKEGEDLLDCSQCHVESIDPTDSAKASEPLTGSVKT